MAATEPWTSSVVRQMFVDFFIKKQNHKFWASSPTVPHDDPTLLFANAGMNQFKSIILGTASPDTEYGRLTRAVNSQKCIRAGGKHNDLEDVGKDTYHHTFFEMLGNWSFQGDFFKKEMIPWAWELLTEVYKIDKSRLYVTVFEGSKKDGVPMDQEAYDMWKQLVPPERILMGNMKDNFWEMGDTGPCGPASEIHYDLLGGGRDASALVNKDDPTVIEVWNLVFMQYDRQKDGSLKTLPKTAVDTGMGLERLLTVLNAKMSNYESDLWTPIFDEIQKITKYSAKHDPASNSDANVAYRVVADHARCLTMALTDGAIPDSVGRGFVLRRIIRRAIRYGVQFLNADFGFFTKLVDQVVATLGGFFTELADEKTQTRVRAILADEEASFQKTWKVGLKHFETAKSEAIKNKSTKISAKDAFILHDRYGFPIDLTVLLAEKESMTCSVEEFEAVMKDSQGGGSRVSAAKTYFESYQVDDLQKLEVPTTVDEAKYEWTETTAKVLAVFDKTNSVFVEDASKDLSKDDIVALVLDRTNFYAEAGGQIYDTGFIRVGTNAFQVKKVLAFAGYVAHIGNVVEGKIAKGDEAKLEVDYDRRLPIAANHTGTHQLNHSLRTVLEDMKKDSFMEVNQKGSLVTEEMLRFDFSYNSKLTNEEIADVEKELNAAIAKKLPVYSKVVPLADAKDIYSIRMMFGEKYPDPVKVVSVGVSVEDLLANKGNKEWRNYSMEFCGGTHLKDLGEMNEAVIVSEDALMKGVRRMVVYSRKAAADAKALGKSMEAEREKLLADKTLNFEAKQKALSVLNKKVGDSIVPLVLKNNLRAQIDSDIKKILADAKAAAAAKKTEASAAGKKIGESLKDKDTKFYIDLTEEFGAERDLLQALNDGILAGAGRDIGVFLMGVDTVKDKAMAMVTLPKAFVDRGLSAVNWAKDSCGKGGGKPNGAQSGLPAKDAPAAIEKAKKAVESMDAALAGEKHVDPAKK